MERYNKPTVTGKTNADIKKFSSKIDTTHNGLYRKKFH